MLVAVMTPNKWPVRATRRARTGSFNGILLVCVGSAESEVSLIEDIGSSWCSKASIPGRAGVLGVSGA